MTDKPETIRTRRRLLGDWNFHSDLADFERMPVEDATLNEFCLKLALMELVPTKTSNNEDDRDLLVPPIDDGFRAAIDDLKIRGHRE